MGDGELSRKARENRARRAAGRQGLRLVKNRRRDARAADYGSYMLTDLATNEVAADFGWVHPARGDHLAAAEEWLARPRTGEAVAAGQGQRRGGGAW